LGTTAKYLIAKAIFHPGFVPSERFTWRRQPIHYTERCVLMSIQDGGSTSET